MVFETAGSPVTIAQTPFIVRRGGTITLVGISSQEEIRGNSKSKIYHCPGQASYDEMADSKNLIIFHSEQEAQDAGYSQGKKIEDLQSCKINEIVKFYKCI